MGIPSLPHLFYLRSKRPVYRTGIVALALFAACLLIATSAETVRLIPLFTIGVFVGFTVSQTGMVKHWLRLRPSRWRLRLTLNGLGACMTAVAVIVFLGTKFLEGAWVVVIAIPLLMVLFARIEGYYDRAGRELRLDRTPAQPHRRESIVIVPSAGVNLLTERAVSTALSLGETVIGLTVAGDEQEGEKMKREWQEWRCNVPIEVLIDPQRSVVSSVLRYIESIEDKEATITVLIPEILPSKRRHEILHNQRGRLLEAVLKARTDVVIATLPFHLHD